MAAKHVTLHTVVNVKVHLPEQARTDDPQAALGRACDLVDLHQLFRRVGGGGPVQLVEFGDDVLGGVVDFEDDPEHLQTTYADGGTASLYLDVALREAVGAVLASGTAPIAELLTIANSQDPLAHFARRGIVLHGEATADQRRGALAQLAEETPWSLTEWLTDDPKVREALAPEDLAPLLEAGNGRVRETALRVLGDLAPRRPLRRGR